MRNAQQRGALCAHGELRNCLYQRQFVSDTRRKSCLQKNFDEVAHERYARSTAGGTSPWCRQDRWLRSRRMRGFSLPPCLPHRGRCPRGLPARTEGVRQTQNPPLRMQRGIFISFVFYFFIASTCLATSSERSSLFFSRPSPRTKKQNCFKATPAPAFASTCATVTLSSLTNF